MSADFSDRYVRRQTFEEKAKNITQPTESECDEPFLSQATEPGLQNCENQMEENQTWRKNSSLDSYHQVHQTVPVKRKFLMLRYLMSSI